MTLSSLDAAAAQRCASRPGARASARRHVWAGPVRARGSAGCAMAPSGRCRSAGRGPERERGAAARLPLAQDGLGGARVQLPLRIPLALPGQPPAAAAAAMPAVCRLRCFGLRLRAGPRRPARIAGADLMHSEAACARAGGVRMELPTTPRPWAVASRCRRQCARHTRAAPRRPNTIAGRQTARVAGLLAHPASVRACETAWPW